MAAGGSDGVNRGQMLTCALCLDIYRSPKLLPCHHTICEPCLVSLAARHPSGIFPCPACRNGTAVPPGGVSAFQTHFYIDPQDIERARYGKNSYIVPQDLKTERDDKNCVIHLAKELEFFCIKCDQAICLNCKLTEHEMHQTEDLVKAVTKAKTQLVTDRYRLHGHVSSVMKDVDVAQKEQQAVKDKKSALQTAIHNRHATLQAVIDKYRDEALASLDTITDDIHAVQKKKIFTQNKNLQKLAKLQQRVQQALDSGADSELLTVARWMRLGRGSEEVVQTLTRKQMVTVCRPVLRFSALPANTLQRMRGYIGSVAKMEMAVSAPEVTVVDQFRCWKNPDTNIYHLCPLTDDSLRVSYEPDFLRNDVDAEHLNADGITVETTMYDVLGRAALVRRKNGSYMFCKPETGLVSTFAKKCETDLTRFYRLYNKLAEHAFVMIEEIVSEDPFKIEQTTVFTLHCAAHRAFDVDASEQLFVVLEEGKTPDWQRRVQLYRRLQPDVIATYSPPVAPFQPSDVCFYKLGGQEMLLVADELNDAIHVVNVQDGRLSFARYLSPGCPLLVQPTALNTDMRGRLWVACRGGRILTCTPNEI